MGEIRQTNVRQKEQRWISSKIRPGENYETQRQARGGEFQAGKKIYSPLFSLPWRGGRQMLAGEFIHMWGLLSGPWGVGGSAGGLGGHRSGTVGEINSPPPPPPPIQCAQNEPVRSNPPLKGRRKRLWRRRRFCGLKIAAHPNPIPPLAAAEAERILGRRWAFILHCVSPPPPTDPSLAAAHPSPNDTSLDTGGFRAARRGTPYGFPSPPKKKTAGLSRNNPSILRTTKRRKNPKSPKFRLGQKGGGER